MLSDVIELLQQYLRSSVAYMRYAQCATTVLKTKENDAGMFFT